jgi:membrane protein YqaA with SNARE-associated domain
VAHFESGLMRTLLRRADRPAFPAVVGAVAVAATVSMSVPFSTLLVAAVLMARRRWIAIAVPGPSLGAALGAALLYLVFHHLGWARLFDAYPDVVRSIRLERRHPLVVHLRRPGPACHRATPLPLTPALMFAGISRLPIAEVVLALWIGKLAKYLVYAWLASRFPNVHCGAVSGMPMHCASIVARALSATPAQRHDASVVRGAAAMTPGDPPSRPPAPLLQESC